MSAGRNLITLFFTVNTLLQIFFRRPSQCSASTSGRCAARGMRSLPMAHSRATPFSKKHFFSAVFCKPRKTVRLEQPRCRDCAARITASPAACPPAENFLSASSTSGVAQAEMRKLIASFDPRACALARWRWHCTRDGKHRRRASSPTKFSPSARRALTTDSRHRRPTRRQGAAAVESCRRCRQARTHQRQHRPWRGRRSQRAGPIAHSITLRHAHRARPAAQKNGRSESGHRCCGWQAGISGRRLRAVRRSRPATADR